MNYTCIILYTDVRVQIAGVLPMEQWSIPSGKVPEWGWGYVWKI